MAEQVPEAIVQAALAEAGLPSSGAMAKALRFLSPGAAPPSPLHALPTTSFVAPGGNDATAVRGQIENPFLTVGAAVTAALSGDAIYVSPGNYFEDVVVDVLNPTITSLSFSGAGFESNVSSISWTPTAGTLLRVSDMQLSGAGTSGKSLFVDGTNSDLRVFCQNVALGSGARFFHATLVKIDGVMSGINPAAVGSQVEILDCADFFLGGDSVVYWGLLLGYAVGANDTINYGIYSVKETVLYQGIDPAILITGLPTVIVDPSVTITGRGGSQAVTGTLSSDGPNALAPNISIAATCAGDVTLTFSPALGGSQNLANLSQGQFNRNVTIGCNAPDVAGVVAFAQNANFQGIVTAGESTTFDIRSSFYLQASLARLVDGTIDRDQHTVQVTFEGGPDKVTGIVPPYPGTLGDSDFNSILNAHYPSGTLIGALGTSTFTGVGEVSLFTTHAAGVPNTPTSATVTITRTNT